jgi:hypothetical protein
MSYRSDIAKRRTEEEEREEKNKDKLNTDLKCQIVKAVNKKKTGFVVIRPSIENAGTNEVIFDTTPPDPPKKITTKSVPAAKGDFTKLSIESLDPQLSFEDKTANRTIQQSGKQIKWYGLECTGNARLRKGEKIPPNEKLVKFNGEGIFVVKFVVKAVESASSAFHQVPQEKNQVLQEKTTPKNEALLWVATAYGSTLEAKEK